MDSKRSRNTSSQVGKISRDVIHARNRSTIAALNELMKDAALLNHRKTLDEVAKAVTRAIESDQKWSSKCQELQAELAANVSKIKIAMQLSEEDKSVIQTLKNELQITRNIVEEMKLQNFKQSGNGCFNSELENMKDANEKVIERKRNFEKKDMTEDRYNLLGEIEKGKLQVFELEEELANKEKSIDELVNNLNSKSKILESVKRENEKLKRAVEDSKPLIKIKTFDSSNNSSKKTDSGLESKSNQIICVLKKKLQDTNKKDQLSLEKIKHLIKNNKMLNRQLQIAKNQNILTKLEIAEQAKMLNLFSCQCCKLEEKDKKQEVTISELQKIRNKYVQMIGNLEQEIHDLKKRIVKSM